MKYMHKDTDNNGNISPKNDGQMNPDSRLENTESTVESRRKLFQTVLAFGLAAVKPDFVVANDQLAVPSVQGHIDPAPNWVPKSLEQRISGAAFIFIGVPTRFRYVSDKAFKKFYEVRDSDPLYLSLKGPNESYAELRKYYDSRPGDVFEFRLHDESETIEGSELTFLEFDLERVIFRRGPPATPDMGTSAKRLYFRLGGKFRMGTREGDRMRGPWMPHLGKRVVLLSEGYLPFGDAIRMPFPEQTLATGPHLLDRLPIPIGELPQVVSIAKRLGYVGVEKP